MSGEHQAFADWLKRRAAAAGYDLDKRGVISQLARDSANDPAQMSRFLRGQAIPAIEGQRGLARALGIKLPEVMIRAGIAEPEDFPQRGPISVAEFLQSWDVSDEHADKFQQLLDTAIEFEALIRKVDLAEQKMRNTMELFASQHPELSSEDLEEVFREATGESPISGKYGPYGTRFHLKTRPPEDPEQGGE